MSIGKNIKDARLRANMTQKELADKLDIPYQSIGQWENGKRKPKLETIHKLANALGLRSASDLIDPTENTDMFIDVLFSDIAESMGDEDFFKRDEESQSDAAQYNGETFENEDTPQIQALFQIDEYLTYLNELGCTEAIKRVEELTHIPKYRKDTTDDK